MAHWPVFFLAIVPILSGSVGVLFLRTAWRDLTRCKAARSWPTTSANIEEINVDLSIEHIGIGSSNMPDMAKTYVPRVKYTYKVGDKTYSSARFSVVKVTTSRREVAEGYIRPFRKDHVLTHYNPMDPEEAVLFTDPGFLDKYFIYGLVLIFFAVFGCFVIALFL